MRVRHSDINNFMNGLNIAESKKTLMRQSLIQTIPNMEEESAKIVEKHNGDLTKAKEKAADEFKRTKERITAEMAKAKKKYEDDLARIEEKYKKDQELIRGKVIEANAKRLMSFFGIEELQVDKNESAALSE